MKWAWAVLAAEAALTALDLAFGAGGLVATEERYNARAGVQLACGHVEALWELQYRTFCGGCSVDAWLGSWSFRALGPTVGAWKLVPAAWHLLTVAAAMALAGLAAGRRAAVLAGVVLIGAPSFWHELSLTGFSNHAQASGLVLSSAVVAAIALRARWAARVPLALTAGALMGAAVGYAWSSAYGLAALLGLAVLTHKRGGWLLPLGIPLGLWPSWAYHQAHPLALDHARDWWATTAIAPLPDLWRWLVTDVWTGGLWPGWPALSMGWWALVWALAGLAGWRKRSGAARFAPLALGALLAAYALRYELWDDTVALRSYDPFNLRYRAPLVPLLAVAASTAAGPWARRLLLGAALLGLGWRVAGWDASHDLGGDVYALDGRPDRTVPAGEPPQRNLRHLGRPQDIAAAQAFLASHDDCFEVCRADHEAELARRRALAERAEAGPGG